jgi:hypothetical protein
MMTVFYKKGPIYQTSSKPSAQFLADLKLEHIKNSQNMTAEPVLP